MSEEENQKLKNASSWDDKKKKKRKKRKKRKKVDTPQSPPQLPDEANPVVKAPEVVQVTTVPRGQMSKRRGACKKNKEPPREPQPNHTKAESPVEEPEVAELDMQVRECLRWEGVLEDPWAEQERLEEYRANRRRRYAAQRDAWPATSPGPNRTPLPLLSNDVL
ncbi:protein LIAT1 [Corythoichthys intestinalis]|uniref:protein LIAT1 n=1 Tax=Corythoichthys intestinalis TaxID=161448 RepID=UPI0025A6450D|nr:protein LIAT1 [Corythoichthys intestinalis]